MNSYACLLLALLALPGHAQTRQQYEQPQDDWVVVSLQQVKTEDVVKPDLLQVLRDPKFRDGLTLDSQRKVLRKVDSRIADSTDVKLSAIELLVVHPTQLQVTMRHKGFLYRAWCRGSSMHLTDPNIPKKASTKVIEPCGKVIAPYVGKTVANLAKDSQSPPTPTADGWFIGVTVEEIPGEPGFLDFLLVPQRGRHKEGYQEDFVIWSVDPAKQ